MERLIKQSPTFWVLALIVGIVGLSYACFDRPVASFFYHAHIRAHHPWLVVISFLGQWKWLLPSLILLALYIHFRHPHSPWKSNMWFIVTVVLIANVLCLWLKILCGRARPDLFFAQDLYGFFPVKFTKDYWSFPSGHTTTIMGFFLSLGLCLKRSIWVFFILGIMIASTRVILYHHYLSDVLAGIYLVMITCAMLIDLFKAKGHVIGSVQ